MEECDGYLYVQGSGDDEEMWSKGLTPDLFWENEDYLLEEGISSAECERRAQEIVQEAKKKQLEKSQHQREKKANSSKEDQVDINRPLFTPSMELCSEIKSTPFWIGNNQSGRILDCWDDGFDMVINCAAEIQRDPVFEWAEGSELTSQLGGVGVGGAQASLCIVQQHQLIDIVPGLTSPKSMDIQPNNTSSKEYRYLHLPIAEGKKGQHQFLEMIPIAIKAVRSLYTSRTEKGLSDSEEDSSSLKILIHCQQGMDRSVGIALAILVSSFDIETGKYYDGIESPSLATKETIQKRLFQIMSHRLASRPSRATLKMVNKYFMSPVDPPPAKYKKKV
ncbi:hypothetical protein BGZ76_003193 [Entomortierella beljakovae]|nr:hypothetical protein BGZ76_003193 [Entomortierella beljakovae]